MRVAAYGDMIADKSGASRTWIGVILMASVTSLPELFTGISASGFAMTPDIAVGDILGSCVFNVLILVAVDVLQRDGHAFVQSSRGHLVTAGFGVLLIGAVALGLGLVRLGITPTVGHVGLVSLGLVGMYLVALRTVFRFELDQIASRAIPHDGDSNGLTLNQAVARYVAWASVVVVAAVGLPFAGERIAHVMGWEQSFVGTMFIAAATSLPEIVVTIGAVRLGASDMAIGNVLGSNLFNVLILAIDDVIYRPGWIFTDVSPVHLVTAIVAVMMTGIAVVGLLYRPRTRLFSSLGGVSLTLLALYLLNAVVLYVYRS